MPTNTDEISLFDKLYCIANFEMFFPFSLQQAAAALHADCQGNETIEKIQSILTISLKSSHSKKYLTSIDKLANIIGFELCTTDERKRTYKIRILDYLMLEGIP